MQIRGHVRTVKTGNPVPDGTEVEIRRHIDSSLIATVVTTGGIYEYFMNGSPGPYYVRVAIEDEVHISSSQVVGMSGPLDVGGLPLYFRLWNDGYISDVLEESSVFASGSGMQVTVRSGAHLVRGVLYDQQGHVNLAVDAADSQPRIDTVVIETMQPGSGRDVEGRTRLVVKKGTPAATPTAPSLTQTTGGIWEHPIANVRIDPAVSSVASNKVTDRRVPSNVKITDGYISTAMLADGLITPAKFSSSANAHIKSLWPGLNVSRSDYTSPGPYRTYLLDFAGGLRVDGMGTATDGPNSGTHLKVLLADGGVDTVHLATGAVTNAKLGTNSVTAAKIANGAVGNAQLATGAVTAAKIATNAVTGTELAANSVTSGHIANGTITESDLSSAVTKKLNAHGYNHSTQAPFSWTNVNNDTGVNVSSRSVSLAPGSWALYLMFDGQFLSNGTGISGMQISLRGTAAGGLVASHAIQNAEGPPSGQAASNASISRMNIVHNTSSSNTTYTLTVNIRRISGNTGRVAGAAELAAIKVG